MSKKLILLASLTLPVQSWGADINIDIPLSFGDIAIRNNTTVSTVSIARSGTQLSTGQIYILKSGTPGTFTLSGLSPYINVNLSVDLPAVSAMPYPNTAQFSMTAIDIPAVINMGPTGTAQVKIGGTLSTSGNPAQQYYSGANYTIYLNLNLDY